MADHLHLIPQERQGLEEAIQGGRRGDRATEIVDAVEVIRRIARHHPLLLRIVFLRDLARVPALVIVELRRDVDEVEELEGRADGDPVLGAAPPIFHEVRLEELVFLRRDAVGEGTGIAHGDLLVPSLVAHPLFPLEGEDLGHRHGEVGEGERDALVAFRLVQAHRSGDGEGTVGETLGDVDGRAGRVVVDITIVDTVLVVAVVGGGGEVDARREGEVRVGLRVLRMRPADFEVFREAVVRQALVAQLRHQVGGLEIARELIALPVLRFGGEAP